MTPLCPDIAIIVNIISIIELASKLILFYNEENSSETV